MKIITLKEAFEILENCSAIIIDDDVLIYPGLYEELTGEDDNEFMYLSWESEGMEYGIKFNEGLNKAVKVIGSFLFLIDTEGEERQITILEPKNLE